MALWLTLQSCHHPLLLLCTSLQLNSLGPDACKEIRDLLLHDKCAVSNLR